MDSAEPPPVCPKLLRIIFSPVSLGLLLKKNYFLDWQFLREGVKRTGKGGSVWCLSTGHQRGPPHLIGPTSSTGSSLRAYAPLSTRGSPFVNFLTLPVASVITVTLNCYNLLSI